MQNVSQAYKDSMKLGMRNRGYIKAYIGVFNSFAQKNLMLEDGENEFTYFSSPTAPFNSEIVDHIYATFEQDYTLADGVKYFLPRDSNTNSQIYNNGMVTNSLFESITIRFKVPGIDIRGLTIDWGDNYPIDFTIQSDDGVHAYYDNDKSYWTTEDVFRGTSFFIITPIRILHGYGRLRIYNFLCGVANIFTNEQVMSSNGFTLKDYVSPISETIPSQDMTLNVSNFNLYYNPDNPDSSLAFMEVGQEVKVQFGYDVTGNNDIEWLEEQTCFLKNWSADDTNAKFTAVDIFDFYSGTYYKGIYHEEGISLFDLATDVFNDAGIEEDDYYIDPYLKKILIHNPMPAVKHTQALQIIANAGRCILFSDRQKRIHIQSSFVPDMYASANNETFFSHVQKITEDKDKDAYAMFSNNFSVSDGSLFFLPRDENYLNTGYISEYISNDDGLFEINPVITIKLEAEFSPYGMLIKFRETPATKFIVRTYYEHVLVEEHTFEQNDVVWENHQQFKQFNSMEIEFLKSEPNTRIAIDKIQIGEITDYHLSYNDMTRTPNATRQNKIKSINVQRSMYLTSIEEPKELKSEEIQVSPENNEYVVYFTNPSYGYSISITNDAPVLCEITESSCYYAKIRFFGMNKQMLIKYSLTGNEYIVDKTWFICNHNVTGEIKEWKNPLISTIDHAKDLEEWLASYFLGDVDYSISWRGDPAVDANDLFYLDLKDRETTMICAYETTLKFSGAWSGTIKARKVVR